MCRAFEARRRSGASASLVDASRAMASRASVDRVVARARLALERCELAVPIHFDACARAALADSSRWVVADDVDASRAHPLVVPLARAATTTRAPVVLGVAVGARAVDARFASSGGFYARARSAEASTPWVVAGARGARLLAPSATAMLRRALAEDERAHGVGGGAATAACGSDALDAYAPGELTNSPYATRVEAFLTRRVGRFLDADERLIERHAARGDVTSALVTAEWCADGPYAGWSRPHAVHAATLARFGRAAEARDQARVALSVGPWWTMGEDGAMMTQMQTLSGYAGRSAADVRRTLEGGDVDAGGASGGEPAPTREETALKRAMDAMDAVAWGERGETWASVRERVAESLDEAGLRALSAHVLAPLRE